MYDRGDLIVFQRRSQGVSVHQVGFHKPRSRIDSFAMTLVETVINDCLMAVIQKLFK